MPKRKQDDDEFVTREGAQNLRANFEHVLSVLEEIVGEEDGERNFKPLSEESTLGEAIEFFEDCLKKTDILFSGKAYGKD